MQVSSSLTELVPVLSRREEEAAWSTPKVFGLRDLEALVFLPLRDAARDLVELAPEVVRARA